MRLSKLNSGSSSGGGVITLLPVLRYRLLAPSSFLRAEVELSSSANQTWTSPLRRLEASPICLFNLAPRSALETPLL